MPNGLLVSKLMRDSGIAYDELAPLPRIATGPNVGRLDPDTFRMVLLAGIEASPRCAACGCAYRRRGANHLFCKQCRAAQIGQTRDLPESG